MLYGGIYGEKIIFKALTVLIIVAVLALHIIYYLAPEGSFFKFFDLSASIIILAAGLGVVSLIKALISKANIYLIIAALLITGAAIYGNINFDFVNIPEDKFWLYIPIGVGILLVFLLLRYIFNIRRWDAGDNEKLGYKNYKERQAEKEKMDIEESIEELKKEVRQKEKEKAILMMDIEEKERQKENIKKKR